MLIEWLVGALEKLIGEAEEAGLEDLIESSCCWIVGLKWWDQQVYILILSGLVGKEGGLQNRLAFALSLSSLYPVEVIRR